LIKEKSEVDVIIMKDFDGGIVLIEVDFIFVLLDEGRFIDIA
jgi:hypothetical protein